MAVSETINSFIDLSATQAEQKAFLAQIAEAEAALLRIQKIKLTFNASVKTSDIVAGTKEAAASMDGLKKSTSDAVVVVNQLKNAQQELKVKNLELSAALKQQTLDARTKATADKEAAAAAKQAAKEAQEAGSERIRQMKAEQEVAERLAQAERDRAAAEAQQFTGGNNQSTGATRQTTATPQASFNPGNALQEQVQFLQKNKAALAETEAAQKRLAEALKSGVITQAEYDKEINKAIILANEYRASIKGNQQAIANIERETNAVKGSLEQRRAALIRLNKEYDNLSPQERSAASGQRLQKIISGLTEQVKGLEKATGRAQRNVGNYPQAATGFFDKLGTAASKAFAGLKTIANIIPGIGLAGLFGLALDPLIEFIRNLKTSTSELEKTKEVVAGTGGEFTKAVTQVNELKNNIELAKHGFLDKDKVVKQYNETIGQTTGQVNNLDEAEKALAKNADNYVKMTLYKAAASLALEEAAKKAFEAEQTRRKREEEFANSITETTISSGGSGLGGGTFNAREFERQEKEKSKARQARREKEAQESEKDQRQFENIAKKFQSDAARIAKENNFNLFGDNADDAKKAKDAAKKAEDLRAAREKADLESDKKRAEARIKTAKEIYENEFYLLETRNNARKAQTQDEIRIADDERKIQLLSKSLTEKQKDDIATAYTEKREEAIKNENIYFLKLYAERANKQKQIDKELNDQYNAAVKSRAELDKDAVEKQIKASQENFEKRASELAKANDIELKVLADQRSKGLITEEEYNRKRERINTDTQKFLLLAQLDFAEENLKILKAAGRDVVKQEEEIAKIRLKIAEDFDHKQKKKLDPAQQKRADAAAELNESLAQFKEYFDQVESIISGALDAAFTAEKNRIQELIDLNEEKKNKEIEAVNQSTLSEQDKQAKITVINARAQAEKERLELRQRQLDQQRARFDKAAKIAQITLNGALAVTAQLAVGNIAGAIIAGALAAAQLALAIATPIPKFRTGTKDAPGGLSILGDGGKKEVVVEPTGNTWMSGDKPGLYDVPKHSVVYPSVEDAKAATSKFTFKPLPLKAAPVADNGSKEIIKYLRRVESAIERKPVPMVQNNMNGVKVIWGNKNSFWDWKQRNMQ